MSLPDNELSSIEVSAAFLYDKDARVTVTSDFEYGGVDLQDSSQGLRVQEWNTFVSEDGTQIIVKDEADNETVLYTGESITAVSGTFDQNMNPTYVFIEDGDTKFAWYDTTVESMVLTNYGSTYLTPKVSLDDKRPLEAGSSDVILSYVVGTTLYSRRQRDRYTVEYELGEIPTDSALVCVGMNVVNRFQWKFEIVTGFADVTVADALAVAPDPATLSTDMVDPIVSTVASTIDNGYSTQWDAANDE